MEGREARVAALDSAVQIIPVVDYAQRVDGPLPDVQVLDLLPRLHQAQEVKGSVEDAALALAGDEGAALFVGLLLADGTDHVPFRPELPQLVFRYLLPNGLGGPPGAKDQAPTLGSFRRSTLPEKSS